MREFNWKNQTWTENLNPTTAHYLSDEALVDTLIGGQPAKVNGLIVTRQALRFESYSSLCELIRLIRHGCVVAAPAK